MIEFINVCKTYTKSGNAVRAADCISFKIGRGEYVAVTGASGSGKTTILTLMGLLDLPDDGIYRFKGENAAAMSASHRSLLRRNSIGFIFQNFNLLTRMNALENTELPLIFKGMARNERHELAKAALDRVGLSDRLSHFPSELSGGQQQRVAVARAIAVDPEVILADEPTGNLDARNADELLAILEKLVEEGKTVVLITHDSAAAARAGRRIVLRNGKII